MRDWDNLGQEDGFTGTILQLPGEQEGRSSLIVAPMLVVGTLARFRGARVKEVPNNHEATPDVAMATSKHRLYGVDVNRSQYLYQTQGTLIE